MNKIMTETLKSLDPQIYGLAESELERQRVHIELIASENFVPRSLLEIQGSILTNKYAEGYPYKKYYGGCEFVEEIEEIAIKRACELFGSEHANVQPHAGAHAPKVRRGRTAQGGRGAARPAVEERPRRGL